MSTFTRIGVVGGGLIGGSIARRLSDGGAEVVVCDPDEATRKSASDAGIPVSARADSVAECDLVVLACPLDVIGQVMTEVARVNPTATVIDVGSVKAAPSAAALVAGLGERYVGVHPMAGTEESGFAHARADLLVGATWAVVPGAATADLTARVAEWVIAGFDAQVAVLDAADHDRAAALISHAPHVVANALLELVASGDPMAKHLAAGSFGDVTRVAGRNPERTRNMLSDNAAALSEVLDQLQREIAAYRADLADPERLLARLSAVADRADDVRGAEAGPWEACPDLASRISSGGGFLVRRGPSGLEVSAP